VSNKINKGNCAQLILEPNAIFTQWSTYGSSESLYVKEMEYQ